jgi:hypothetical protein
MRPSVNILVLILYFIFTVVGAYAASKDITGIPIPIERVRQRVQYILRPTFFQKDYYPAPYAAIVDQNDYSLKFIYPAKYKADSVYCRFQTGDQIEIRLAVAVSWDQSANLYEYRYTLSSTSHSLRPIWQIEMEWLNDYQQIYSPEGWIFETTVLPDKKVSSWSTRNLQSEVQPGGSISGFGFTSIAPPIIVPFKIWGRTLDLGCKGLELLSDDSLDFVQTHEKVIETHGHLDVFTVIPGIVPESIEPVEWYSRITSGLYKLKNSGYMSPEVENKIYRLLTSFGAIFGHEENHNMQKMEQEVSKVLEAMLPYREQIEPEAWFFIEENLRFPLCHSELVHFMRYPGYPKK